MEWTLKLTQRLRRLAREGKTAAEAAAILGEGVTKNMVISRAYRARPRIYFKAGLPPATPLPTPAPARPKFAIISEVYEPVHNSKLRPGDGRCRFPLWPHRMGTKQRPSPEEMMYCGKPALPGTYWCEECHRKVYMPAPAKVGKGQGRKVDQSGRRIGWQYGT